MELERMGFDMTLLAFVILGNAVLVAAGAGLVAYLKRVISAWKVTEAARQQQHKDTNDYTPTGKVPVSHAPSLLMPRRRNRKVTIHPSIRAMA